MNLSEIGKLKEVEFKRKEINDQITELKNKQWKIEGEYLKLIQEKCKENIGRCFKKMKNGQVLSYCKIIDIDKLEHRLYGQPLFNQYQYPTIWFWYPYNGSKMPFNENGIHSSAWREGNDFVSELNGIYYEEISKEEFFEKFSEVNQEWVKKFSEI